MSEKKFSLIKILDSAIFVLLIIFLLSLSNSIFVNQMGYYGALLLILIKWAVTKEYPFSKTGIEFALVVFVLAEVLSTIFSDEPSAAFHNLLKRVLLIPIIYVTIASVDDFKKARIFVKVYLGATLITVLIYLYFAAEHYFNDLYGLTESGPSIFQYPITASEIISFTVIFLFAFLVNEKTSIRNKIFIFIGFLLSSLALFSTYKRTGWMGAAFGILVILIIKKQWKVILIGATFVLIFLLTQKNISQVYLYELKPEAIKSISTFDTEGKAFDAVNLEEQIIVSDYDNGLIIYSQGNQKYKLELPSAVIGFYHWKDNYYVAALMDTRFILLEKQVNRLIAKAEFFSPGYTFSQNFNNDFLYVMDIDSGLTVFNDPADISKMLRYPQFSYNTNVFTDSSYILFAEPRRGFSVYRLNEKLPSDELVAKDSTEISFFYYSAPFIFSVSEKGMKVFSIINDELKLITEFSEINNVFKMTNSSGTYIAATTRGTLYFLKQNPNAEFYIEKIFEPGFTPKSINLKYENLLLTRVESKQSRLLGVFDPNHPSNANRIAFWQAGIKMFIDNPVFGLGDIDLAKHYKLYKKPHQKEIQGHLHNNFFHILATLGLFGLIAVIYLFYKIIQIDLNIIKELKNKPFASSFAIGTLAAFCGFLISGLTELNFFDHEIATLIWFTFGLNVAFFRLDKGNNSN